MKKIDLGQTITILANIGVIAGIAFLVVELQQNNEFLAAQARSESLNLKQADAMLVLENPDLARAVIKGGNNEPLSDYESLLLTRYVGFVFSNLEATYAEVQRGLIDVDDLPVEAWIRNVHDDEFNRSIGRPNPYKFWQAHRGSLHPEFVQWYEENVVNVHE